MATNAKVNEGQAMIVALSLDTVPGDILFEIFQKLPQSSFGPLAHTCRALRIFIEENGIALCNSRIKMLYSATLNRLTIEAHPSGWLVPFTELPSTTDEQGGQSLAEVKVPRHSVRGGITHVSMPITSLSHKSVALAGPQLLALLDTHNLPIRGKYRQLVTNGGMAKKKKWVRWVGTYAILSFLETGVRDKSMSWFYILPGVKSNVKSEDNMEGIESTNRKDGEFMIGSAKD
ncbi:hypothetical protein DL95DRAFT_468657 [Leptodontidium sp. 2 PMI_412]|nr:hypothetical protein DL95DRAFT_468657 [Leptodontidium sp. 2 PMI_412]